MPRVNFNLNKKPVSILSLEVMQKPRRIFLKQDLFAYLGKNSFGHAIPVTCITDIRTTSSSGRLIISGSF